MSNRIQGARLKAAAVVHAKKQLAALGVSFNASNGTASFKGDTAYATWTLEGDRLYNYRINYPALPDNAVVNRREADLIAGYTLHELGHIAYTDNGVIKGLERLKFHLWNGIEDARIEHAVIKSGRASGARSAFKRLMSKFTMTVMSQGFNPASINSAPFALALICRAALGDGNGFAKTLLDRIPEPKRSLYANVANRMPELTLDRQGSAGALALASEFLDAWLAIEPDALKKPEPVITQAPEPQEAQQPQQPQQQFGDGDDDFDFDFDGEAGDAGEAADAGEPTADSDDGIGDVDQSAINEALENAVEDAPLADDSALFAQADDESDDTPEVGTGFGTEDYDFPDLSDTFSEDEVVSAEPNVDDIFKQIMERTKSPVNLPPVDPAKRTAIRNWNTVEFDEVAAKRAFRKLHKAALPALKSQLYRMLKAPERCGWDAGALGGRFDGKRTARMMAGSESVFKRRWMADGINTAVSVVVDLSGSMQGESIKQSVDLAWTIAEACESANADVEVVGFTTRWGQFQSGGCGLDGEYISRDVGDSSRSPATLIVAKRYQDKVATSAQYFALMKRLANGGTPDYGAVRSVCEQLSANKAQRKLVIVITDGCGQVEEMKALTESAYDLYGVDVIGFGIGISAKYFAQAYAIGDVVGWNLSELHKTCLKSVADQLAKRDMRRAA